MATQPRTCAICGTGLGRRNTSGRCQRCAARLVARSPETRAKISASRRRRFQTDPEFRAREAERLRQVRSVRTNVGGNLVEGALWQIGNAVRPAGSPSRMQAGAKTRARRAINAGCPPHLVEQYYFLTTRKRLRAAEAIAAVKAQEEAEMRRWRRSLGVEPVVRPDLTPDRAALFIERASAVAAVWAGAPDIWVVSLDKRLVRARWAVYLALHRAGWPTRRIARETGMERKGVIYALERAEVMASAPGEFAELVREVCAV